MRDEKNITQVERSRLHPSSLPMAEAVGVEPTGGSVSAPATLAGSLPCRLARLPEVARVEGRCGSRTRRGLAPTIFETVWPATCRTFPVQERPDSNRDQWVWNPPCCRLHNAPKTNCERCGRKDSNLRSRWTPVLQTGAFAAQPRPRKKFARLKNREGDRSHVRAEDTLRRTLLPRVSLAASSRLSQRRAGPPPFEGDSRPPSLPVHKAIRLSNNKKSGTLAPERSRPAPINPRSSCFGDWRAGDPLSR